MTLDAAQIDVGSSWNWYGPDRRAAKLNADQHGITIIYGYSDDAGGISEVWRERAPFHHLPVHLGGMRRLFGCPGCGRRCRFLYAGGGRFGRFACRICSRLRYHSENLGKRGRIWWRMTKIRRRVDDNATVTTADEFPERRPRMKRRTYEALRSRHDRLLSRLWDMANRGG
jgi:hypothetical protein